MTWNFVISFSCNIDLHQNEIKVARSTYLLVWIASCRFRKVIFYLKVPLTPKICFALLQNVSDLEMFKTKIKKIHKILTLLWTFKVAMFSFSTAL